MSQYPSYPPPPGPYTPYPPSPYGGPPPGVYGEYLSGGVAPVARRAGLLMFITGGLMMAAGACNSLSLVLTSTAQMSANFEQQRTAIAQAGGSPPSVEAFRIMGLVMAGLMLAVGVAVVSLGVGVRRGGRGATIAALILSGLLSAGCGLLLLVALVMGLGAPPMLIAGCMLVVPTALLGLQTAWLIGAVRHRPAAGAASAGTAYQQYAAQWYQYQQAAQAYGGGYGYGAPTAAPVEPPPPEQLPPASPG